MDLLAQMEYLFAGFAVFWAGLLTYLVILQARLRALQTEVTRLEERLSDADAGLAPARTRERAGGTPAATPDAPLSSG